MEGARGLTALVALQACLVAVKTAWIAQSSGVGRPRQFAPGWLARSLGEGLALAPSLRGWVEAWTERPFDLHWPAGWAGFELANLATGLTFACLLLALSAAFARLGAYGRARTEHRADTAARQPATPARVVAPALLGALAGLPAWELGASLYWGLVTGSLPGPLSPPAAALVALASAATLWAVFLPLMRLAASRSVVRRLAIPGLLITAALASGPGILAAAESTGASPAPAEPGPAGVVLISIDTLRADRLGCYGNPRDTSPVLDALAADGVRFENARASSSWTLPTHLTLLTGLPPAGHGVVQGSGDARLATSVVTLAEVFRSAGYATAAFVVPGWMDAEYGHIQGFQHYDDYSSVVSCPTNFARCVTSPDLIPPVEAFLRRHRNADDPSPFFVFVHVMDVHNEYIPPPPFDTMFDPEYRGSISEADLKRANRDGSTIDRRDLEHILALYDGEIRFVDGWIGRLLETLKELGIYDRTVVAVTSDHGEEFFEHGRWNHAYTLYAECLHIPLILRYPRRIPPGTVVAQQVRQTDVAPTLLSLASVPEPPAFEAQIRAVSDAARDLVPLIDAGARGDPVAANPLAGPPAFADLHGTTASIRWEGYKLVRHRAGSHEDELYNVAADPQERENLAREREAALQRLRARLEQWRERWRTSGVAAETLSVSESRRERLRALGYLE